MGRVGLGVFGISALSGPVVSAEITASVFRKGETILQCGFGALVAVYCPFLVGLSPSARASFSHMNLPFLVLP